MVNISYTTISESYGSHTNKAGIINGKLSLDGIRDIKVQGTQKDLIALFDVIQNEIENNMDKEVL